MREMPSANFLKVLMRRGRAIRDIPPNFLKVLVRSKRAVIGIAILVFFALLALGAPLITPFSPIYSKQVIAAPLAYPVWFKYIPGLADEKPSENLFPIEDPGFLHDTSVEQWVFSTLPTGEGLTLRYVPDVGRPEGDLGSVAIDFQRDSAGSPEQVKAILTKEFYYPFEGPPKRFLGQIFTLVEGVRNVSLWGVEIKVFIQRADEEPKYLWSAKQGGAYQSEAWITPNAYGDYFYPPLIDSYNLDQEKTTFSVQANYKYGVEIVFNEEVQRASVYVDDLDLRLYGFCFGLLGTDNGGLDVFTQLAYGARISLLVGVVATLLSVGIGLIVGLFAPYLGRVVDEVLMRFTDMLLVIPELPLLLVLVAVLGPSIWNIIAIIGLLGWMGFARTVRSQTLSLKERAFVEAAKAVGAGKVHIITRHILPNVMNLVYVTLAMSVPAAIMSEAYLSFLGLYDPFVMTWGRMLNEALELPGGFRRWWWIVPPGLCIAAISISFILMGYALDEILNPKIRERQ